MDDILVNLGKQLKKERINKKLSLKQVAEMSNLSIGLISKIENFRTTPSLPVLLKIMHVLEIDLSQLNLNSNKKQPYILIKNGEGSLETRDDSKGLEYKFLFSDTITDCNIRAYIINVKKDVYRKPTSTDAIELVYVLKGKITYALNKENLELKEGDILFFDGNIPHSLQNNHIETVSLFKIYMIKKN